MIDLLKDHYWSRADTFILPLTGLSINTKFGLKAYLYWKNYGIDSYQLILKFEYEDQRLFTDYCRQYVFPILDKNACVIESYDVKDRTIFILDLSEWAMDIETFLSGKYSKLTDAAKKRIEQYWRDDKGSMSIQVWAILYPNVQIKILNDKTAIDYVIENYGFLNDNGNEGELAQNLRKQGEIGSKIDKLTETLVVDSLDVEEFCQVDMNLA